jgi:uncharacterized protein
MSNLIQAVQSGDFMAVTMSIAGGEDVNHLDENGRSALMYAAYNGLLQIIVILIASDADVNQLSGAGTAPLDYACKNGQMEAAKLLVEHKATMAEGEVSMMFACDTGNEEMVSFLLEQDVDPNMKQETGMTPLIQASWKGYLSIVRKLIEHGADVNFKPGRVTALGMANSSKHDEIISLLKEKGAKE